MTAAHSRADTKGQSTTAQPIARRRRAPIPKICSIGLPRGIMTNQSHCGLGLCPRVVRTQHSSFQLTRPVADDYCNNRVTDKAFRRLKLRPVDREDDER